MSELRRCTRCKEEKSLNDFGKRKFNRDGRETICRTCIAAEQAEYRRKHPDRIVAYRKKAAVGTNNARLKRLYGIDTDDYKKLTLAQSSCCAICKIPSSDLKKAFDVDHDHETGRVRGLLCNNCNRGIGHLKDSVEILASAIAYLKVNQ